MKNSFCVSTLYHMHVTTVQHAKKSMTTSKTQKHKMHFIPDRQGRWLWTLPRFSWLWNLGWDNCHGLLQSLWYSWFGTNQKWTHGMSFLMSTEQMTLWLCKLCATWKSPKPQDAGLYSKARIRPTWCFD